MGIGYLTGQGGGGSNIKSFQTGAAVITNLNTLDIAISAIDTSKSVIRIWVKPAGSNNTDYEAIMAKITSSTQINLSRKTAYAGVNYIQWEVIEFNNVKSKQSGDLTVPFGTAGTFQTTAISSVDVNKSLIFGSFKAIAGDTGIASALNIFKISSATEVSISKAGQSYSAHWQVIEFK